MSCIFKIFTLIFLFAFFLMPSFSEAIDINGTEYNNIRGWAWSDNIGWISFSCHSSEAASQNLSDQVADCANNWGTHIVMDSESGALNIPARTVIGHAWSDNVGWISFERLETGDPPTTGNASFDSQFTNSNYLAKLDSSTNRIIGWARVLSACTSISCSSLVDPNWDGWIQFMDTNLGVTVFQNGTWSGFAWGNSVLGWIEFDSSSVVYTGDPLNTISQNTAPVASMVVSPSITQSNNDSFNFFVEADASASYDTDLGETATLSYFWNWGDSTTSTGAVVSHTYNAEGNYTIILTVTDINGAIDTVTQSVSFVSPDLNACLITCSNDSQCPGDNTCFIPNGNTSGFCIASPQASTNPQTILPTGDSQSLSPYDCALSLRQPNVLSVCSPFIEACPQIGFYSNGNACSPGEYIFSTDFSLSEFSCGKNAVLGDFCIGPELEICPESGICPLDGTTCTAGEAKCRAAVEDAVYNCVDDSGVSRGTIIDTLIVPSEKPLMPIGLQSGGEACTQPTQNAPNNCEGINGCLYYNYDSYGNPVDRNSFVDCTTDAPLELSGCIYYGENGEIVNVCDEKYPTGCIYYEDGLTNCLPSGSLAGIPAGCNISTQGFETIADCTADTVTSNSGAGCIFSSNGAIDCTNPNSQGRSYSGYVYNPNPEYGISYKGISNDTALGPDFVDCVLTDVSVGSVINPQDACSSDGSCPNQGDVCLNGTCVSTCDPNVSDACDIGASCVAPCGEGEIWNSTTGQCEPASWLTIPQCDGAYVKETQTSDPMNVFLNLPVGITQAYIGLATDENVNCKYSTNPEDTFNSPTMTLFGATGLLSHETLVTGLFPLPDINRYLIRCENTTTGEETSACQIPVRVGEACTVDADCTGGSICLDSGYCGLPACSGSNPPAGTIYPSGTINTNIGMTSGVASVCKFDTNYYDQNGGFINFFTMENTFSTIDNISHSESVSGLVEGYNAYYVQCQDLAVNINTGQQNLSNKCQITFEVGGDNNTPTVGNCDPGTICANGAICPENGVCPTCPAGTVYNSNSGSCDFVTSCTPGTICPDSSVCPQDGICGGDPCPLGTSFNIITGICETGSNQLTGSSGSVCNVLGIEFQGTAPGTGIGPSQNCSIVAVLLAILQWFAWLVAVFAVVYGLRGGYTYITSAGDAAKLELAKRYIIYTMVGVVVAVLSFSIIAIARSVAGI